jgi:hypothetical protein
MLEERVTGGLTNGLMCRVAARGGGRHLLRGRAAVGQIGNLYTLT